VFVWSPSTHQIVAHSHTGFHDDLVKLFMSRSAHESSTLPWLPNELMFEICHALFELYRDEDRS